MADIFGWQSKAFSVGTGTEGGIGYNIDRAELSIEWVNPFVGENRTRSSVSGGNLALFRIVNTTGAGNENALMRFEVFERASRIGGSATSARRCSSTGPRTRDHAQPMEARTGHKASCSSFPTTAAR
jgi:hypothetical protein